MESQESPLPLHFLPSTLMNEQGSFIAKKRLPWDSTQGNSRTFGLFFLVQRILVPQAVTWLELYHSGLSSTIIPSENVSLTAPSNAPHSIPTSFYCFAIFKIFFIGLTPLKSSYLFTYCLFSQENESRILYPHHPEFETSNPLKGYHGCFFLWFLCFIGLILSLFNIF